MTELTELQEKAVREVAREELRKFERRFWIIAGTILVVGVGLMLSLMTLSVNTESQVLGWVFFGAGIVVGTGTAYFIVNCPWYYKKEDKEEGATK